MPKGPVKKTNLTRTPFQLILLLLQYTLLKIGQVPIVLVQLLVRTISIERFLSKKKLPSLHLPNFTLYTLNFTLPRLGRGPGRPRKTPLVPFYLNKLKRQVWLTIPLKLKVTLGLLGIIFAISAYTSFILTAAYQLPTPERLILSQQPLTTEFYDRNGKLLYRLYEGRNRTLVKLDELPKQLIWATISTEDKNFYQHLGFEPMSILRAIYENMRFGKKQGASTITQQLVKNSLLTPEKTISRKLKEIILAFWAERIYSKDQILQMYFNEAPYGGPAWGIEAASQTYFGKSATQLTLAESAFLAGLPASPTQFSPYGSEPALAKTRQSYVLDRMVEEGYINELQKQQALAEPLALRPPTNNILAPHFVFYVRDLLAQKYGQRVVSQGGLKIYTSLDLTLQQQVEQIIREDLEALTSLNVKNGAAMVLDAPSGQILAMVGSRDYFYPGFGNYNVTLALRQPGSSIKVVTYLAAFKKGFSPANTILDTPVSFKDGTRTYSPVNYDGSFHGPVSIRTALGSSYNVPAVRMLATLGIEDMIQTAKDLGISTFNDPSRFGLSLTLGGGEVRMMEMMGVYGALSQLGILQKPTPILQVVDSAGNTLDEYQEKGKQVLKEEIAYLLTSILSDNKARTPAFGPSSLLHIPPHAVAVKTGTSDNKRDNWTFGYTEDFVVGVWVGNNDNSPMHPILTSGVTGATPIWNKITRLMLETYPSLAFKKPPGIVEVTVDGRRDLAVAGSVPKSLVRVKRDGDKVVFSDAFSTFATPSASLRTGPSAQASIKDGITN